MASASIWLQTEWELSTSDANKEKHFYITFQLLQSSQCFLYPQKKFHKENDFLFFPPTTFMIVFTCTDTFWKNYRFNARPLVGGVFQVMQEYLHIVLAYAEKNPTIFWIYRQQRLKSLHSRTRDVQLKMLFPCWCTSEMTDSCYHRTWKLLFLLIWKTALEFKLYEKISTYFGDSKCRGMQV